MLGPNQRKAPDLTLTVANELNLILQAAISLEEVQMQQAANT